MDRRDALFPPCIAGPCVLQFYNPNPQQQILSDEVIPRRAGSHAVHRESAGTNTMCGRGGWGVVRTVTLLGGCVVLGHVYSWGGGVVLGVSVRLLALGGGGGCRRQCKE